MHFDVFRYISPVLVPAKGFPPSFCELRFQVQGIDLQQLQVLASEATTMLFAAVKDQALRSCYNQGAKVPKVSRSKSDGRR